MFDSNVEKDNIVKFLKDYYQKCNAKGAVLGISGGKDSAVVAALMVEAIGKDNVIGVTMPCHSKDEDKEDALLISDYYGFKMLNLDLTSVFDTFKTEVKKIDFGTDDNSKLEDENIFVDSDINIKPRLRMLTNYYLAALLSKIYGGTYLVIGTSNKAELYVGYFTKGGDSVHDIAPIADLTVEQVIKIGEVLKVPEKVLYKKPSDGLSNKTDEDKLGVSYEDIAKYMEDVNLVDEEIGTKIKNLHEKNSHKFEIPKYKLSK